MRNLPRNKGKIRKPVHRIIRGKRGERQVSTNRRKSITRLSQPRIQHLERIGSRRFRYRNSRHVNPITERFVSGERNGREEEQEGRRLSAIDIDAPYPVDRNSFPSSVGDEGPSKACPRVFQSKLEARERQAWKRFTRAQESDGSGLSDIIYRMKPAITDLEVNLFFYFLFFSLTVERREMEKVGRTRRILLFSPPRWKWFPSRHAVYLSNTGISRFQRATLFRPIHGQQRMRAYKRTVSTIFFLHAYVYITFHFNRSLVSDPATILPILSRFFSICGSVCLSLSLLRNSIFTPLTKMFNNLPFG